MKRILPLVLACAACGFSADAQWKPLFDGKTMDGWTHVGPGSFSVDNGMLKTSGGMGLLFYNREKLGNSTVLISCRQTISGALASTQSRTIGSRALIELTFQVTRRSVT